MITYDVAVKRDNDNTTKVSNLHEGDVILAADGEQQEVKSVELKGYAETYAVVCGTGKKKAALYGTLGTKILAKDDSVVTIADIKIGTALKDVGTVTGVAYSGERKVYELTTDKPYFANGFVLA